MNWDSLELLMVQCLDCQIYEHGSHRIDTIYLGPKEFDTYDLEMKYRAFMEGPKNVHHFCKTATAPTPKYNGYAVKPMNADGVAIKIKAGKLKYPDDFYWPTP